MAEKELAVELAPLMTRQIHDGVCRTFDTLMKVRPETLETRLVDQCDVRGDVSGLINILQETNESTLILSFPKDTILKILSQMYRKELTEIDAMVRGGVGELTNMIYGVIKTALNKDGFAFKMAIPNVILGDAHIVSSATESKSLVMPFRMPFGDFNVVLTFAKKEKKSQAA